MPQTRISIRQLEERDYPEVARIHREGLATGNAAYETEPVDWETFASKKILELSYVAVETPLAEPVDPADPGESQSPHLEEPPRSEVDSGEAPQSRIVGWLTLMPMSERPHLSGMLENSIYISGDAAGRGVGKKLLEHCFEPARRWGAWSIFAWIYPENKASRALHEKAGFNYVGTIERHGKMDHGPWAGEIRGCAIYEKLL